MNQISLRAGGPKDRDFIVDLGRRTVDASVSSLRPAPLPLVESSYERLVDFVFDASHSILIAHSDLDGPLGFIVLLDELPDEVSGVPQGFVAYMAVEPAARRLGVAAKLLAAGEDAARARGRTHMALMVTEDNLAARELYAQAGYATERRLLCKPL